MYEKAQTTNKTVKLQIDIFEKQLPAPLSRWTRETEMHLGNGGTYKQMDNITCVTQYHLKYQLNHNFNNFLHLHSVSSNEWTSKIRSCTHTKKMLQNIFWIFIINTPNEHFIRCSLEFFTYYSAAVAYRLLRFDVLSVQRCSSAYHCCNLWLFELLSPSCPLWPVWPFSSDLSH